MGFATHKIILSKFTSSFELPLCLVPISVNLAVDVPYDFVDLDIT